LATASIDETPTSHPIGFYFIFLGELAERASFYGMRAILTLYLVHVFAYKKNEASSVMHFYMAACYFAPLIGGLLADKILNKYWTIVGFSIPYVIGQFIVGLSIEYLVFGALCLLSMGSGIIKPNISTLLGLTYDQQRPGQTQLRTSAFGYFYMAINIGSFLSTTICPKLRNYFGEMDSSGTLQNPQLGYFVAFLFPAILMAIALGLFAAGKRFYAKEELGFRKEPSLSVNPDDTFEAKMKIVGQLGGLFFLVMFFWAIFDQHATTWIYFAESHLNLALDFYLFKLEFSPDQIQAANPAIIVIFVPIMNIIYRKLAKKGYNIRATDKMLLGFFLTALAMLIHSLAGYSATNADGSISKVSVLWQLAAIFVITIAEILISVTGLELAFTAAPSSLKGFVTSLWLCVVGIANLAIDVPVTQLYPGDGPTLGGMITTPMHYFNILTIAMFIVTVVFVGVAHFFNKSQRKPT
jgi:solute carrier family 15 (oligopeptide transporter), member 1